MERRVTINKLMLSKTVAFFPSVCLLINAMTGPAIPFTANLFQEGGWFPTILLFVIFGILSTFCCLFIVEAMQAIPGNRHFQGNVEYATLINFYFGKYTHIAGQICLYGAVQSNAIQSIALSSQTFDNIIAEIAGQSCGLATTGEWICRGISSNPSPFGDQLTIFTIGYIIVILFTIPLSLVDLDNNINVQVGSFILTAAMMFQWVLAAILFLTGGASDIPKGSVSALAPEPSGYQSLIGNVMLSLAFTYVVPSWVNLKSKGVSTQGALWTTSASSALLYILIGWIPGVAFLIDNPSGNMIPPLALYGIPTALSKITTYSFPIVMLLPSIPVSFLVTHGNLVQNELATKRVATFVSFIAPWFFAIPFVSGNLLNIFINWTSLLFVSTANFIIPVLIFLQAIVFRTRYNQDRTTLTPKQRKLLKLIHFKSNTIKDYIDRSQFEIRRGTLVRRQKPLPHTPQDFDETHVNLGDQFEGVSESDVEKVSPILNSGDDALDGPSSSSYPDEATALGNVDSTAEILPGGRGSTEEILPSHPDQAIEKFLKDDVPDPVEEDRVYHEKRIERKATYAGTSSDDHSLANRFKRTLTEIRRGGGGADDRISFDNIELEESSSQQDNTPYQAKLTVPPILENDDGTSSIDSQPASILKKPGGGLASPDRRGRRTQSKSPVSFEPEVEGSSGNALAVSTIEKGDGSGLRSRSRSPAKPFSGEEKDDGNNEDEKRQGDAVSTTSSDNREYDRQLAFRKQTLPTHPQYVGRTFRSVPLFVSRHLGVASRTVALICLSVTSTVTLLNIVLNIITPPN